MGKIYEATVDWVEEDAFRALGPSGHAVVFDGAAPDAPSRGPGPVEALLLAFGACDGINVVGVLRKMRQDVTGYAIEITAERAEQHPQVLTAVAVTHVVRGRGLDPEAVRRAVELSATKYCSVGAMLREILDLTESYTAIDEATGAEARGTLTAAA
jgi:putative redox protein